MKWKTALGMISLLVSVAVLAGCGAEKQGAAEQGKTKLTVFAAASMTETMNEIAKAYQQEHPDIEIVYNLKRRGLRPIHFGSPEADGPARCVEG